MQLPPSFSPQGGWKETPHQRQERTIRRRQGTKLLASAANGDAAAIHALLNAYNIDPNYQDSYGHSALILAARNGHCEAVQRLLDTNADPNLQDSDGATALIYAAAHGHAEVADRLLLMPNINANAQDNDGMTALMYAARNGRIGILKKLLLAKDADRNSQDKRGLTALMHAATYVNAEPVQLLLQHGVDASLTDNAGDRASILAHRAGNKGIWHILRNAERQQRPHDPDTDVGL